MQATIAGLRICSAAHNELIARLEAYQRQAAGTEPGARGVPGGYGGGYRAELTWLHSRHDAIDSLITAAERYQVLVGACGGSVK